MQWINQSDATMGNEQTECSLVTKKKYLVSLNQIQNGYPNSNNLERLNFLIFLHPKDILLHRTRRDLLHLVKMLTISE